MTNHIASTSRWRLLAGALGALRGRAVEHLRQAFSGFIAPELAAAAVRRSTQRAMALLPAPAPKVEPELPDRLPQSKRHAAEPVAAAPTQGAADDTIEEPTSVPTSLSGGRSATSPRQRAARRAGVKTAGAPEVVLVMTEPVALLSPSTPKQAGQGRNKTAAPVVAPPAEVTGHFAPEVDVPPSVPLVVEPVAASPITTEFVAAAGSSEKAAPAHVFASAIQARERPRQRVAKRGGSPTALAAAVPAAPAAAPARAALACNETSAAVASPQPQADPVARRRTKSRKVRHAAGAVTADRATDNSDGRFVNSSVVR